MALVETRGIKAEAPILDDSAVWTPPHIGPTDAAHLYMAASILGASPTDTLPDMLGNLPLVKSGAGWDPTGSPEHITITGLPETWQRFVAASEIQAAYTILAVVDLARPGSTHQMSVPGYHCILTGTGGIGYANDAGAYTVGSFSLPAPSGKAVFVYRISASGANRWVNGEKDPVTVTQGLKPLASGQGLQYRFGSILPATVGSYEERWYMGKVWNRALSDAEVLAAVADAKRLFKIA